MPRIFGRLHGQLPREREREGGWLCSGGKHAPARGSPDQDAFQGGRWCLAQAPDRVHYGIAAHHVTGGLPRVPRSLRMSTRVLRVRVALGCLPQKQAARVGTVAATKHAWFSILSRYCPPLPTLPLGTRRLDPGRCSAREANLPGRSSNARQTPGPPHTFKVPLAQAHGPALEDSQGSLAVCCPCP